MSHPAGRHPLLRFPRVDWTRVGTRWLPFADAASADLPLSRLLRLALFQVSVGLATVLTVGTLNRVMIVELGVGAWLVSLMVGLPLLVAPLRAVTGWKSDLHKSVLGWKRVPYIWIGTLLQFGGLAIMPFALLLLSGETSAQLWAGHATTALAFLLVGAGLQTTQTAGLALAADLVPEAKRPRAVALMYAMLLVGMVVAGLVCSALLLDFTPTRLVQVVQGAAVLSVLLNLVALWKQEPRQRGGTKPVAAPTRAAWRAHWAAFAAQGRVLRFLVAVGLGSAAFNMQDIILEPYGAEVLGLPVAATTLLTALMAGGALVAFGIAARLLSRGAEPHRVAAAGVLFGLLAFSAVIFAEPLQSAHLFRLGVVLIGFGGGLFAIGTLTAAMNLETHGFTGLAIGAWGAVQATCAGVAVMAGGVLRDVLGSLAMSGALGQALVNPATGYGMVYHLELLLLFATLVAIGPLVRRRTGPASTEAHTFGLAQLPG